MFGTDKIVERLDEVLATLDHTNGLLESVARLLRLLVEQDRVDFEPDAEAFGLEETIAA